MFGRRVVAVVAAAAVVADQPVAIERPDGIIVERLLAAGHPVIPVHPNHRHDRVISGCGAWAEVAHRRSSDVKILPGVST